MIVNDFGEGLKIRLIIVSERQNTMDCHPIVIKNID